MMGPVLVVPVVALVVLAAACQPTPPPLNPSPAQVDSVVVSPQVVTAGSEFQVTVSASDDQSVELVQVAPVSPTGQVPFFECRLGDQTGGLFRIPDPGPAVQVVVACTLDESAPNGEWSARVSVSDGRPNGNLPTQYTTAPFEVVGGSDDLTPPVVDAVQFVPEPPVARSAFQVVVRISDDVALTPALEAPRAWYSGLFVDEVGRACDEATVEVISSTVQELTFSCPASWSSGGGTYRVGVSFRDAAGHLTIEQFDVEIVAAP